MLLLIDHSNLLYRAYYSSKPMQSIRPWIPVLRYLDMLRLCGQRVQQRYPGASIDVIFAGESKTKLKRTEVDPTYKSQRKPIQDPIFHAFRQVMSTLIEECGWEISCKDGAEADDIIASIVQNAEQQVVIFSNDRDLRQLLCFSHAVIYQNPGIFYTSEMFEQEYGFDPDKFVYYKALVGDKSDNIAGVYGWGPAKAKKHILSHNFIQELETEGRKDEYWRAMELVRLRYDPLLEVPGYKMEFDKESEKLAKTLCKFYSDKAVEEVLLGILRVEEILSPK